MEAKQNITLSNETATWQRAAQSHRSGKTINRQGWAGVLLPSLLSLTAPGKAVMKP